MPGPLVMNADDNVWAVSLGGEGHGRTCRSMVDGIGKQIADHLRSRCASARRLPAPADTCDFSSIPASEKTAGQGLFHRCEQLAQFNLGDLEVHDPGVDRGKIQNVVDRRQQQCRRCRDVVEIVALRSVKGPVVAAAEVR